MSIEATSWALAARVGDSTRKFVLVAYANHAHKDGRNVWASKETIADYVECHPKTVRRHVQALIAAGWMREGDQQVVAHLRADRRPVVYELAMSEATRAEWEAANNTPRGDNLSGRDDAQEEHEGATCPPVEEVTGGHTGGHPCAERGDTAVSPEPSTEPKNLPPHPPASGGTDVACQKPGQVPHANCRGCATTTRQLERQRAKDAEQRRRDDAAAAAASERAARVATEDRPPVVVDLVTATRQAIAQTRTMAKAGRR